MIITLIITSGGFVVEQTQGTHEKYNQGSSREIPMQKHCNLTGDGKPLKGADRFVNSEYDSNQCNGDHVTNLLLTELSGHPTELSFHISSSQFYFN